MPNNPDDLVRRLLDAKTLPPGCLGVSGDTAREAAAEIEKLRAALERAAENFERLQVPHIVGFDVHNFALQAAKIARQALGDKKDG